MADSITIIGSKGDLAVDASRCLRMRYSESSCRLCIDICPHGAILPEAGPSIDSQQCRGCLLCTNVCPVGALEQYDDFSACLVKLSRVPEPVLGCVRTQEQANAAVACLGGLSQEHLILLCHALPGKLTLNLSMCCDCPNSTMVEYLRQRLEYLTVEGLPGGFDIVIAESAHEIGYREESVGRRSFFKSLSSSLFQGAAVMLSASTEQNDRHTEYAAKRLPVRREQLNRVRSEGSSECAAWLHEHFDSVVLFNDNCTNCHGCVAICPTGALRTEEPDSHPVFEQTSCTGCGLCQEFCLDDGLTVAGVDDVR